jgi:hypothetical protein
MERRHNSETLKGSACHGRGRSAWGCGGPIMGSIMGSESLISDHGVRVLDLRSWGQSP